MSAIMTEKPFFARLPDRALIHIEGADRAEFLQGLITNDIHALTSGQALYACLLNAQGKFLHDFFIHPGDGFLVLDCEGGERAQDLYNRLNMYRLRSDVQISVEEDVPVYAISSLRLRPQSSSNREDSGLRQNDGWIKDPRHPDMGYRSFEKPDSIAEQPFEVWDRHRIMLCVPDGSRDMEAGKSTLLECGIDKLNGVSFEKGCYVGQELTARMHYRGLAKKHLCTVQGDLPESGSEIFSDSGSLIGHMRSRCGDIGLALLKDDRAGELSGFTVIANLQSR